MIISVEYNNGRIKEFDPSTFTTSQALPQQSAGSRSIMTEFDLRVDEIEKRGLCLDMWWYDITDSVGKVSLNDVVTCDGDSVDLDIAGRQRGASVTLVTPEGMNLVSRVVVYRAGGSSTVAWRQGSQNWLINGAKFDAARILAYSDGNTVSSNLQALKLYNYLRATNPDMDDEAVSESFGYPLECIEEIIQNETKAEEMERDAEREAERAEGPDMDALDEGGLSDGPAIAVYRGKHIDTSTGEIIDDGEAPGRNAMEDAIDGYEDDDDDEDEDDY